MAVEDREIALIACETIKHELEAAMEKTGKVYPTILIDSDYHNDPDKLRMVIQEYIDSAKDKKRILLGYGCCGNALVGVEATTAQLVIPKTDDCISMMLSRKGEEFNRTSNTYFLTKGWMESPKSLAGEYYRALEKYGEAKTKRIFELMLKNYEYLMIIDTGAYDLEECINKAEEIAHFTKLKLVIEQGDIWYLEKLLTGPYDNDFSVIPKGEKIKISHFGYGDIPEVKEINVI